MRSISNIVKTSNTCLDKLLSKLNLEFSRFNSYVTNFYKNDNNDETKKKELVYISLTLININRYLLEMQFKALRTTNHYLSKEEEKKIFCNFVLDEIFNEYKVKVRSMELVGYFTLNDKEPTFDEVYKFIDERIKEHGCGCKKGDK